MKKIVITDKQISEIFSRQLFNGVSNSKETADYIFERNFSFGKSYRIGLNIDLKNIENKIDLIFGSNPEKIDKLLITETDSRLLKKIEDNIGFWGSRLERLQKKHLLNIEEDVFWDINLSKVEKLRKENEKPLFNYMDIISKKAAESFLKNDNIIWEFNFIQFEEFIYEMLKGIGFKVELTPQQKDGGKDVICTLNDGKTVILIELKLWKSQSVGNSVIKKLEKTLKDEKDKSTFSNYRGLIISPSGFTENIKISHEFKDLISIKDKSFINKICQRYLKKNNGFYLPNEKFDDILLN